MQEPSLQVWRSQSINNIHITKINKSWDFCHNNSSTPKDNTCYQTDDCILIFEKLITKRFCVEGEGVYFEKTKMPLVFFTKSVLFVDYSPKLSCNNKLSILNIP